MVQVERLVVANVTRNDVQQEIPVAHDRVATEHFRAVADRQFEFRQRIASLRRQFDVRKYHEIQAQGIVIKQGDPPLDHTAPLELRDPPPAGRGREVDDIGNVGGRAGAVFLKGGKDSTISGVNFCLFIIFHFVDRNVIKSAFNPI